MDYRTKKDKLKAMANQNASPIEAEIARKKLAELEAKEQPPYKYYASGPTFYNGGPFPSNPKDGDIYTDINGRVWWYNAMSNKWTSVASAFHFAPSGYYTGTYQFTQSYTVSNIKFWSAAFTTSTKTK